MDRLAEVKAADERLAIELSESESQVVSSASSPRSEHAAPSSSDDFTHDSSSRAVFASKNRFDYLLGVQVDTNKRNQRGAHSCIFPDEDRENELAEDVSRLEESVQTWKRRTMKQSIKAKAKGKERLRREEEEVEQRAIVKDSLRKAERARADLESRVGARRKADEEEATRNAGQKLYIEPRSSRTRGSLA